MLTSAEIKRLNLIRGAEENNFRAGSYDLRVGTIIKPDGSFSNSTHFPRKVSSMLFLASG